MYIIYTQSCNYSFLAHIQILPIYWTSEIDAVACIAGWTWTLSSWRMTLGQSLTFLLTLLPTLETELIRKKKAGMHRGNSELSWSLRELIDGMFVFGLWKQRCSHQTCEGYSAINYKIFCLFVCLFPCVLFCLYPYFRRQNCSSTQWLVASCLPCCNDMKARSITKSPAVTQRARPTRVN